MKSVSLFRSICTVTQLHNVSYLYSNYLINYISRKFIKWINAVIKFNVVAKVPSSLSIWVAGTFGVIRAVHDQDDTSHSLQRGGCTIMPPAVQFQVQRMKYALGFFIKTVLCLLPASRDSSFLFSSKFLPKARPRIPRIAPVIITILIRSINILTLPTCGCNIIIFSCHAESSPGPPFDDHPVDCD